MNVHMYDKLKEPNELKELKEPKKLNELKELF